MHTAQSSAHTADYWLHNAHRTLKKTVCNLHRVCKLKKIARGLHSAHCTVPTEEVCMGLAQVIKLQTRGWFLALYSTLHNLFLPSENMI